MTDWLTDTLLATSALMLLVLVLRGPVRTYFGARTAYALWLLPAGRALMPTLTDTVTRTIPAPQPMPMSPFMPSISTEPQLMSSVSPAGSTLIDALGGWPTIATVVWIGVALGFIARGLGDFTFQRREILRGSVQLARIGSIRLVRSAGVRVPAAFGLIDRVIVVPCDFDRRYDERERCLALDHELAHHRHGDLFANAFAFVLLSLQWFNPLAWWSYAAFRFDQEAACDARVLDKAMPRDRAVYGRAIAKAASGRALLLASTLDHRTTLHRRLKYMLISTTSGRRVAGIAAIGLAMAIALPLTATRAIAYVDVAAPAKAKAQVAPVAAVFPASLAAAPVTPVAPATPVAPVPPTDARQAKIIIDGKEKDWSHLTPEERAKMRAEIAKARRELAEHHIDRGEIQREIRDAMAEANADHADIRRDLTEAHRDVAEAMREIDAHAAEIRRSGQDPEAIKATVRAALRSVEAIDVDKIRRDALASVDEKAIEASLRAAEQGMRAAEAALDQAEAQAEDD